ncbi:MAG: chitobiase/beta-hexosaminidase C-terminal domain-containing protein [Fibrobacteria bacterium]
MTLGIACLALFAAAPAYGQAAPVASPDDNSPFVNEITVTLTSPGAQAGDEILYQIGNSAFNPPYNGPNVQTYGPPLHFTATTVLKAVAKRPGLLGDEYSSPVTWNYVKAPPPNQAPSVVFSTPANGTNLVRGTSVTFTATVTDPDATTPYTSQFSRKAASEATWTNIGSSITGATPSVTVNPVNFPLNTTQIRVVSVDAAGGTDNAIINVTVSDPPNDPPAVSITQPSNNASIPYATPVTVNATASDTDPGVQRVEFYATPTGGTRQQIGTADLTSPYSASEVLPPGTYALTAIAYDNATPALQTTSSIVNITVLPPPNTPPTVSITEPSNNASFPYASSVTVNATASDSNGGVQRVQFYATPTGGTRQQIGADDLTSPYSASEVLPPGTYALTAIAYDNGTPALSTTSSPVNITVLSPPTNQAPTAKAGADVTLQWPANTVSLNGGTSTDPEGTVLKYAWTGPAGVTFTGANTATPVATIAAPGAYTITLKVTDSGTPPLEATDQVIVTVNPISDSTFKPTITSALKDTAKMSQAFSYTIQANGNPAPTFTASPLPAGLTLTGNSISGTPTVSGNYSITLTATNSKGSDSKVLALTINADPVITQNLDSAMTVQEKTKAVFTVKATGFPAVRYEWQYRAGTTGAFKVVGPNSATYTIDPTTTSSAGYYQVVVISPTGTFAVSRMCQLKITPAPLPIRITTNPSPLSVIVGDRVQFKTKATGGGKMLYQWFKGTTAQTSPPSEKDSVFVLASAGVNDGGLFRARVTSSLYPDTTKPEGLAYSDTARLVVQLPKLPKPKSSPKGGPFWPSVQITLSDDTAGTNIHYTTDGSDPTQSSPTYTAGSPLVLEVTRSVRARAYKTGFRASDAMVETFTRTEPGKVIKPVNTPPAPTFKVSMNCTLKTATPGAAIYYTLDGTSPLTGTPKVFSGSIPLTQTTTIIAVAKKAGMVDSDTLKVTYTLEAITSKVLAPTVSPLVSEFVGKIAVTLTSATDGATIWYTTDGSSPDSSSTHIAYVAGTPITLSKTTKLRAVATKPNFLASDIVVQTYNLIPGPITATPPQSDEPFDSVITVKLAALPAGATIRFTTEGVKPGLDSPVFPAEGLTLTATTTISAIAVMDGVSSTVYAFNYTRSRTQLAPPSVVTTGNQSTFKDTMSVGLFSTRLSTIYYTLNGDIPTTTSEKYSAPILIDSTVTLQAIAVQNGYSNSKILIAPFTLVPEMPTATPSAGSYPTAIDVHLSCSSKRVKYFYTLDGEPPTPDNHFEYVPGTLPIVISASSELKAYAVAGNSQGPMLEATYEIFGLVDFTLEPGKTILLGGGYTLRNPGGQPATVAGNIGGANQLKVDGFSGIQYVINLKLSAADTALGTEFPDLVFARPTADKRSMYQLDLSQKVQFISGDDTVTLSKPGSYFMGIDKSPPVIRYVSESFDAKDSTRVHFEVEDNVSNLSYDLKRNDNPALNLAQQTLFSGQGLSFSLKHPPGSLKPLSVQLIVNDYQAASFYPKDPGTMLSLSQRLGAIKGPDAWSIGAPNSAFDFIGIPLALDTPLTLAKLRDANPGAALEGVAWKNDIGKYLPLDGKEVLRPGQGYWIGARSLVSSLSMKSATTLPSGKGNFTVQLKHGWNQIANPHLEELYWPYSRKLGDKYKTYQIKGLFEFTSSINDFTESESMKPWRGYFVYSYVAKDTTVILSPRPITEFAMKKASAGSGNIRMTLGCGLTRSLVLGADPLSSDGLGREDEFSLPRRDQGTFLRALRDGSGLASDWVRLRLDGIQEWKVALDGSGDSLPALRVLDQDLPEGYETWAVSPSRSMKFRLEAGRSVPASGLTKDTLLVYSGPREKMARFNLLQNLSVAAPPLDLRVSARNGGFNVQMALPSKARIRAFVWALGGVRQGEFALGPLSEGSYAFTFAGDFRNRPARLAPGIYFLTMDIQGAALHTRLTRKIVLSD